MSTYRCSVVLVPYVTHIDPRCEEGLRELETRGIEVRRYQSTASIDRARSDAATEALDKGFDELIWIDSNMRFDADDVERLRSHDLPVVAGVYPQDGVQDLVLRLAEDTTELKMGDGGGLCEVRYVGAGFLCTQRIVYEAIQREYTLPLCNTRSGKRTVPYFLPMVAADLHEYMYLGDDYAFCERARQAGYKIMVDTTILLGHVGSYVYGWEDAGQKLPRSKSGKLTPRRAVRTKRPESA